MISYILEERKYLNGLQKKVSFEEIYLNIWVKRILKLGLVEVKLL